jgi:hypothetical protein
VGEVHRNHFNSEEMVLRIGANGDWIGLPLA